MKRGVLILSSILLISFVSAQMGSLGDLFSSVPSSTIFLGAIWIASFALIFFAMMKVMKGDQTVSAAVAFAMSVLITWGANKTLDVENLSLGLGISPDFISNVLPLLIIGIVIFLFFTLKTKAFLVLGGILSVLSFTNLIYEKGILMGIGFALLFIGAYFAWKNRKNEHGKK